MRRVESDKAAEYYEKTKAARKARIDADKDACRAEDMARLYTALWQIYVITNIKISQMKTCVCVLDIIIGDGYAILY